MNGSIEKIYQNYEDLKRNDFHINAYDSESIKRMKSINIGKMFAYEEVIKILQSK